MDCRCYVLNIDKKCLFHNNEDRKCNWNLIRSIICQNFLKKKLIDFFLTLEKIFYLSSTLTVNSVNIIYARILTLATSFARHFCDFKLLLVKHRLKNCFQTLVWFSNFDCYSFNSIACFIYYWLQIVMQGIFHKVTNWRRVQIAFSTRNFCSRKVRK